MESKIESSLATRSNMSDCLQIKNFGPIKDATIELKPFLVIIGGQGTGKSTITKVLTICQELFWYIQILEESKDVLQPFHIFGIADYFQLQLATLLYTEGIVAIFLYGLVVHRMLTYYCVTVLVAISRPAEFIEITFQQQMQKS